LRVTSRGLGDVYKRQISVNKTSIGDSKDRRVTGASLHEKSG
jgi:hypothetical protein